MKVVDFEGRVHNFPPPGYHVDLNDIRPRSSLHLKCRKILKQLYPTQRILEEVPIPNVNLFLDFFIPSELLAIEVQGEQHYKFNEFFYKNKLDFIKAQKRDVRKKDWCIMNNIILMELPFNENDEDWIERIKNF